MSNLSEVTDERFERLVDTFNQMVSQLELNTQQMQQLSRMILRAQEEERYRLARELHDEAAQSLTSLLVRLRLLERAHNPEDAQQRVQELRELTARALEDVRASPWICGPRFWTILASARRWSGAWMSSIKWTALQATIHVTGLDRRLPRETELALYRVGQEALSNVSRHAQASHVAIKLQQGDGVVNWKSAMMALASIRTTCIRPPATGWVGRDARTCGELGGTLAVNSAQAAAPRSSPVCRGGSLAEGQTDE